MRIIISVLLFGFVTTSWGNDPLSDALNGIFSSSSSTSSSSGSSVRVSGYSQEAQVNTSCDMRTLPIEFFSKFTGGKKFEAELKGNKIVFTSIVASMCLTGENSPVNIGLEQGHPDDYYVVTARVKDAADYASLAQQIADCIKNNRPGSTYKREISFSLGNMEKSKPLVWGVSGNIPSGIVESSSEGDPLPKGSGNKENSCFRKEDISDEPIIVLSEEDEKIYGDYVGRCKDCDSEILDKGAASLQSILRKVAMIEIEKELEEYVKKLQDEENDSNGLDNIEEIKKFLLGEKKDYNGGLIAYYRQLIAKKEKSKPEQEELERMKKFLQTLAKKLSPQDGEVIDLLQELHAYNKAGKLGFLGMVAEISVYGDNNKLSLAEIKSRVRKEESNWNKHIAESKRAWRSEKERRKKGQAYIDNPKKFDEDYSRVESEYRDAEKKFREQMRKSHQKAFDVCAGRRRLPLGLYLQTGSINPKRTERKCERAKDEHDERLEEQRRKLLGPRQEFETMRGYYRAVAQAKSEEYQRSRERGDSFFDDGFGYSDDLYSPYLNRYEGFQQGQRQGQRLPPSPGFLRGGGQLQYSSGFNQQFGQHGPYNAPFYSNRYQMMPNMFQQGPPSYAMPPNFQNPALWGQVPRQQGRWPTGHHSPPPYF